MTTADFAARATRRFRWRSTATILALSTWFILGATACDSGPSPAYASPSASPDLARERMEQYRESGIDYTTGIQDYTPAVDYLNYGLLNDYEHDPRLRLDDRGVPLVEYDGEFAYNPVTVGQFALTQYGRYTRGAGTADAFLAASDALISLQQSDGSFPNQFAFTYYRTGEVLEPGWVSGMSQGVALSVFRRSYDVSHDAKYLAAGDAALDALLVPASEGGSRDTLERLDRSLTDLVWFKEYPTAESQYTLNGMMFTLLGLYDWSGVSPARGSVALAYFNAGIESLAYSLAYFDIDGISAYDLGHIVEGGEPNVQIERHGIHIQLLHALNSVRPTGVLKQWEQNWIADITAG